MSWHRTLNESSWNRHGRPLTSTRTSPSSTVPSRRIRGASSDSGSCEPLRRRLALPDATAARATFGQPFGHCASHDSLSARLILSSTASKSSSKGFLASVLADAARAVGALLVHVSSDCVFRGDRGPYTEDALPDAVDLYGRSKARGEVRHPGVLTVRTSFVGHEVGTSHGLLAWLLSQRRPVPGFTNHLWSGVTAPFLARTLLDLATRTNVRVTGVLHVHGEDTSKARLLRVLSRAFRRDVPVLDVEAVEPVDRRLRSAHLGDLGVRVPPLEELAHELAATAQGRGARS